MKLMRLCLGWQLIAKFGIFLTTVEIVFPTN